MKIMQRGRVRVGGEKLSHENNEMGPLRVGGGEKIKLSFSALRFVV